MFTDQVSAGQSPHLVDTDFEELYRQYNLQPSELSGSNMDFLQYQTTDPAKRPPNMHDGE